MTEVTADLPPDLAEILSEIEYLTAQPQRRPADGRILVHNFTPGYLPRRFGDGGFRFWLQRPDWKPELHEPCSCEWAPRAGTHYTTARGGQDD